MIKLITKIVLRTKNYSGKENTVRQVYGTVCSIVGIILNICLFTGKYLVGTFTGSIAVTADAFNNLSDAGSSFITLIGFRFSGKKPDMDHPYGHGRFEYISGFVVSMAILMMGVELVRTSVEKIINPKVPETGNVVIIILLASILVKLYMVIYNNRIGRMINSGAMVATATDSLSDMVATTFVLISTVVIRMTGINIDGYSGIVVAIFILVAGYRAAKDTINPLLGKTPDPELIANIRNIVMEHEHMVGVHDMIIHDYGPGRMMVSLHAEVPGNEDIFELHEMIDHVERELYEKLGCRAVIHMDPVEMNNDLVRVVRKQVEERIAKIIEKATIHDFRLVQRTNFTNVVFDVVVPYSVKESDEEIQEKITQVIRDMDSTYYAVVDIDRDAID